MGSLIPIALTAASFAIPGGEVVSGSLAAADAAATVAGATPYLGAAVEGASSASSLASFANIASIAGSVVGAAGSISQGISARNAANYNAEISANNAKIATQNAQWIGQEGEANAAASEQKTRATVGAIMANQAAGGINVNTGSAVDVRSSAAELGELNAINIRANATRQAYGAVTQAAGDQAQSALDKSQAKNDLAGGIVSGASSLLSGVGSAESKYQLFQQQNSIGL